jgi:hypothetical protein
MPLPVTGLELELHLSPQVLEGTTHDDEILPVSFLIADVLRNQELLTESEAFHDAMGTRLRSHEAGYNAIHSMLRGEMKEFASEQGSETQTLPVARDDQPNLGDIVAPTMTLKFERTVGHNLVLMDNHYPFHPLAVITGRPPFDDTTAGHVEPRRSVSVTHFSNLVAGGCGTVVKSIFKPSFFQ